MKTRSDFFSSFRSYSHVIWIVVIVCLGVKTETSVSPNRLEHGRRSHATEFKFGLLEATLPDVCQSQDYLSMRPYCTIGGESKFDLQVVCQCVSVHNCLYRPFVEIHFPCFWEAKLVCLLFA